MRAIPMVLGATAVLTSLTLWRWTHAPEEPPARASGAAATSSGEVEVQREALQARIERLEQLVGALQRQSEAGGAASSCPSAAGLAQHLAPQSGALEGDDSPAPDLASTFDRDQRPARHAPHAAQLESRVRAVLPGDASLDRLECRGEICRLEVTVTGIARYREFLKRAFSDPSTRVWDGATKLGYVSEPDPQNWEHDQISVFAYLGPQHFGSEP